MHITAKNEGKLRTTWSNMKKNLDHLSLPDGFDAKKSFHGKRY